MNTFCYSCGMMLQDQKPDQKYCQYCIDESGKLKYRAVIQQGIAGWLEQFGPKDGSVDFQKRAEFYMKAMPEWAEE